MNLGVLHSKGEIVLKADAHSSYPTNYISGCVQHLLEFNADMAGGVWTIAPRANTHMARAIALGLAHWFASGNAHIKIGTREPRWSDAAAFGCWKRDTLLKLGPFDEALAGSSDMDMNRRLRRCGGRILLVPGIRITYYADPDLGSFWRHNFGDGVWATYVLKFGKHASSLRHWVPLAFITAVLMSALGWLIAGMPLAFFAISVGTYGLAAICASMHCSLREKTLRYVLALPMVFAVRHIAHGMGALYGIILALMPGLVWKGRRTANA
jgi:hypothetical protein